MRTSISQLTVIINQDIHMKITARFGVATLDIDSGENADRLIARSDEAHYRAKSHGRNRVC